MRVQAYVYIMVPTGYAFLPGRLSVICINPVVPIPAFPAARVIRVRPGNRLAVVVAVQGTHHIEKVGKIPCQVQLERFQ